LGRVPEMKAVKLLFAVCQRRLPVSRQVRLENIWQFHFQGGEAKKMEHHSAING
jgi:hypothetical protein